MSELTVNKYLEKTYQRFKRHHQLILWAVLLPLVTFSILTFNILSLEDSGFSWDISLLLTIHQTFRESFYSLASFSTNLGGFKVILLFLSPIILLLFSQTKRRLLTYLIVTIFSSAIVNLIIKIIIHRSRPQLWQSDYPFPSDFSFPSGHAMGSITLALALLVVFWGSRYQFLLWILAGIYVGSIAWTRLYLGVHFPSDIIGGWLLGIAWTALMTFLFNLPQSNKNTN
ncbi:phosphatase PAP2 family protein [Geminocystis sp. CENA526]|uniref:phosphatase PAP2 family protein n=1 Tax=Geminocystis sp. CENA526 TaxID=1355871 RepID=UPI003D6F055C